MSATQPIIPLFSVYQDGHRYLLSASRAQLEGIANALNEVCKGANIGDFEFQTRLGTTRAELRSIITSLGEVLDAKPSGGFETTQARTDGGSVQARCMSAYGESVDMSSTEARKFGQLLIACADQADAFVS